MGKLGLGMQVFGALLGGDPTANQRRQQYEQAKAQYKRAEIAMRARRALGKVQYAKGVDRNLAGASRAVSRNNRKWQELRASTKWKSYEIYKKSIAAKGTTAASGMIGTTAKRLETMRKSAAGISQAKLVQQMTSATWRLNESNKDIWSEYKAANRETYNRSGIGRVDSIGAPPVKPKGPSFLSRIAPVLGVLGNHFVSNYKAPQDSFGDIYRRKMNFKTDFTTDTSGYFQSGLELGENLGYDWQDTGGSAISNQWSRRSSLGLGTRSGY